MGVPRPTWTCPKGQQIVSQLYLKNEFSYEVSFFACCKKAIEVTLSIISSGSRQTYPKVIQNNKLDFLHIGRLQQKQAITVGISKILEEN